jgi:hypothetical protein
MIRYIVIFLFTLLFSSCKKEPIPIINRNVNVNVVIPQNKTKMNKKKRKIKLLKIFKKKVVN